MPKCKTRTEWLDLLHKCQNGDATCMFVLGEIERELENNRFGNSKDGQIPDEWPSCIPFPNTLNLAVSQAIQAAISAHIEEYSKLFPDQAWGRGALHARLLPAIMVVLDSYKI